VFQIHSCLNSMTSLPLSRWIHPQYLNLLFLFQDDSVWFFFFPVPILPVRLHLSLFSIPARSLRHQLNSQYLSCRPSPPNLTIQGFFFLSHGDFPNVPVQVHSFSLPPKWITPLAPPLLLFPFYRSATKS